MTMINIAIAGGNGAIGRTILRALQDDPDARERFRPFIFTRHKRSTGDGNDDEIEVPYRNVEALKKILEEKEIHTVVSALDMAPRSLGVAQLNLIHAANRSACTRRFVATNYAMPYVRSMVEAFPSLEKHFACLDALTASSLEWTEVVNGLFLDYYGMPEIDSEMAGNGLVADVEQLTAAIPGEGGAPVSFTYSRDVARFVVKMLGMAEGKWERQTRIVGDTITWKEFATTAKEATGEPPCFRLGLGFEAAMFMWCRQRSAGQRYGNVYDEYRAEILQWSSSIFELMAMEGATYVERDGALNGSFPEIRTMTVRDVLAT